MKDYNAFQVKQLTRLIEVTRTNLPRSDRQKVRRGRQEARCRGRKEGLSAGCGLHVGGRRPAGQVAATPLHTCASCVPLPPRRALRPPQYPAAPSPALPQIMNMITIDAHSRDMVANIVDAGEKSSDCFLWMCQLRSYWDQSLGDCRWERLRWRPLWRRAANTPERRMASCAVRPDNCHRPYPPRPQDQDLRRVVPLWLRIPGQRAAPGYHAADGPHLHHRDPGLLAVPGHGARRSRRCAAPSSGFFGCTHAAVPWT